MTWEIDAVANIEFSHSTDRINSLLPVNVQTRIGMKLQRNRIEKEYEWISGLALLWRVRMVAYLAQSRSQRRIPKTYFIRAVRSLSISFTGLFFPIDSDRALIYYLTYNVDVFVIRIFCESNFIEKRSRIIFLCFFSQV